MSQPRGGERCPELQNLEPNIDGCDMMADNFDNYPSWLQRDRMANTSRRVSRPEEEGVKRLLANKHPYPLTITLGYRYIMANTSTRVSRPEEEGVKRLVAMAGERDSGETCRLTLWVTKLFHVQPLQDLCV